MLNLIIDIGNSRMKCAVMSDGKLLEERIEERIEPGVVARLCERHAFDGAIVSSTRGECPELIRVLQQLGIKYLCFGFDTPVPLRNDYLVPERLGRDRLAAAVGADVCFPGQRLLIVDFGTAITCDLVCDGCFCGGFISPGLQSRFRALHDYTAALPMVAPPDEPLWLGRTTEECIAQGVELGICYEIEGHMARLSEKMGDLTVIFTGGDAKRFVKRIKNTIFADCDLVYVGLNRILEYHVHAEK